MNPFRSLAIAFHQFWFEPSARRGQHRQIHAFTAPEANYAGYYGDDYYGDDRYSSSDYSDESDEDGDESYSLYQSAYAYPDSYHPMLPSYDSRSIEGYEDSYEDEYGESDDDEDFCLVEYRLEVLGGDAFIEYSYEGNLDEAEIMQALNVLWSNSLHHHGGNSGSALAGTLRMPLAGTRSLKRLPY